MNNQRMVDLEARVHDLELALETQSVAIGRLLGMGSSERQTREWLAALHQNMDRGEMSRGRKVAITGLLYGHLVALDPDRTQLRIPE